MSECGAGEGELLARLLRAVGRTAAQQAAFTQAVAQQLGVGPTDLECLAALQDLGPASAGQLAEVLGLTTGAITGVVDRLVGAGFVARETDPDDRRRVIVQAVPERIADLERRYGPVRSALLGTLGELGEVDPRQLLRFEHAVARVFQRETASLRAESAPTRGAHSFSARLDDVRAGQLEFASGLAGVRICAAEEAQPELLYQASFDGPRPTVKVQGGAVVVRYARVSVSDWARAKPSGAVALNPGIPWRIGVQGGASGLSLDARGLQLQEVCVRGGASKVEVVRPRPRGEVRVCLDGGVNRGDVRYPPGTAVQLQVYGGANRLEFDAQRFGAVGGDVRLTSPGWEQVADRYVIEARGGASRLSVNEFEEVVFDAELHTAGI